MSMTTKNRAQKSTPGVYCFLNKLQPQLLWYAKWNCISENNVAYAAYVQFTDTAHAATNVVKL